MFDDEQSLYLGLVPGLVQLSAETMQQQHIIFSWLWIDDIRKLKYGITPNQPVEFEDIGRFTPGKNKALPSSAADSSFSESPVASAYQKTYLLNYSPF